MNMLLKKPALQVTLATLIASVMILVSGNGVADAVKTAENASVKGLKQKPLPPPGPFGSIMIDRKKTLAPPAAPQMPVAKQAHIGRPIVPSISGEPLNEVAMPRLAPKEPELKRLMPNNQQALGNVKMPKGQLGSSSLGMPNVNIVPPVAKELRSRPNMPKQLAVAPPFSVADMKMLLPVSPPMTSVGVMPPVLNQPLFPQQPLAQPFRGKMPDFKGKIGSMLVPPKIQQYRYIPLPVYQSNFGNSQPPPLAPQGSGLWVPQIQR